VVGKEITLQDNSIKLTNTKHYCYNHLKDCPYFAAKYLSEQIKNILSSVVPSTSKNQAIISFTDDDNDDNENDSLTCSSTLLLVSKKQTTLSQYIGHPLNASEVENPEVKTLFSFISPHLKLPDRKMLSIVFITSSGETLIWRANDISIERQQQEEVIAQIRILFEETKELNIRANCIVTDLARSYAVACHFLRHEMRDKTLVTKDNVALDDELKLPADIKAAINHDSFWNSLVTLHDMLHPFCKVLDIMQRDKACLHNVLHTFGYFMQIFKELEDVVLNEWEELLIDKELEEEWDDLDDTNMDIDFLNSEIHSAEDQAAK
ncbi:32089_t:CDS:2, partial [Racocetra persica]